MDFILVFYAVFFASVFTYSDVARGRISLFWFTCFGFLGVAFNLLLSPFADVIISIIISGVFVIALWPLEEWGLVGAGDVLFMAVLWLIFPFPHFAVWLAGLPIGVPIVAMILACAFYAPGKYLFEFYENSRRARKVAFGPFLFAGLIAALTLCF